MKLIIQLIITDWEYIQIFRCQKMTTTCINFEPPQWAKWFSRYFTSKSGIWARLTSPFCGFSASFSLKYDVTDPMLQNNEKMKAQYLRNNLFETLQAVRTWKRNFASFQISLPRQLKSKLSVIEKQKIHCLSKSDVQKVIWNNAVWLLL